MYLLDCLLLLGVLILVSLLLLQPYRAPVPPLSNKDRDTKATSSASTSASVPTTDNLGQLATNADGSWNVCYLYLHSMDFSDNVAACPVTNNAIENIIPRHYSHALFSVCETVK